MKGQPTSSASTLYGPGGDVNAMTADAVRAYSGDPGQQFANQANWNLQLQAGLREQAFVGGLQDQFGQLANDALAASRAQDAALKQQLGSEFAGSANWALAQQRAEHAATAARQAAATHTGLAGFDLGRGANDWSDDAAGFDLGRGPGWGDGSLLSRAGQWLDQPIQPLQGLADTVRRGNAMMADGLDAVGLSGLASAQRALGDVISGSVPTRPWEVALSAAPLTVKAPGALRFAGEALGPNLATVAESQLSKFGLQPGIVPSGPSRIAETVTVEIGRNRVTWGIDANGAPVSATGTLRESFGGAVRGSAELQAQTDVVSARGLQGDQGGHLVAHRFVLDQGAKNLFPQEGNFNMSAFKTLENDYARYVSQGYTVDFSHSLGGFDAAGRPGSLSVTYGVRDTAGTLVDSWRGSFFNQPGQVYPRRVW